MKKILLCFSLVYLMACNDYTGNENSTSETDSAATANPTAIDTVQHPNGMSNGSVISRDTAAMRVDTSVSR